MRSRASKADDHNLRQQVADGSTPRPGWNDVRLDDGVLTGSAAPAVLGPVVCDTLAVPEAAALARRLAPCRHRVEASGVARSLVRRGSLPALLGVGDFATLDREQVWGPRAAHDLLRVPIGVTADGAALHLDLKESAADGMGPYGLVVGATGSGKSELLRTLVTALARTHPPEELSLVLVDFTGGATFAGLQVLPHLGGLITNLEADPALVGRAQDALGGELVRRQQLLRDAGVSSRAEYAELAGRTPPARGRRRPARGGSAPHRRGHPRVARAGSSRRLRGHRRLVLSGNRGEGPVYGGVRAEIRRPGRGTLVRCGRPAGMVQLLRCDPDDLAVDAAVPTR